ncbi:MAG TPA: hypothetical protein VGS19_38235, partial [Streptosporangiaceae bacterium]|nr:hypothetical protein [Streptosporangiaceae bacterium]
GPGWPLGVVAVGFFSRLLVPRKVRRALHPGRAVRRVMTPKVVKKGRRALHPVDNVVYTVERTITTTLRSGKKQRKTTKVWQHGTCPVKHRSAQAAARCRNP